MSIETNVETTETTKKRAGRKASIVTIAAKVEKLRGQVAKLEAKKTELAEAEAQLETMRENLSPENLRAERDAMAARLAALQELVDSVPAEDSDED